MANTWYKNLSKVVKIILSIFLCWPVNCIARITSGKGLNILIGILCLIGGVAIFWFIDLITLIMSNKILFA